MSGTPLSPGGPRPRPEDLRDEVAQLREAMQSQRDIGMAVGLLSARFGLSTAQAWRTMLRISQDSNTKIRTVARVLVVTHDGTADPDDLAELARFEAQLPASGWPSAPGTREDPVS
ncbi:hypothetical protein F4692_001914 [Nocardioides cavernae]|uniref:ANTAR domain-containing protein n=1 Tax=Nocardioides cavernae TaxID=1921566 RepID=A0A7Y9H381_9ACTN|nr:ANTAR domain-containing protein [Nocardioides cavernae]NYE36781.1 hypothetical protein [Nocardioides cavernae]